MRSRRPDAAVGAGDWAAGGEGRGDERASFCRGPGGGRGCCSGALSLAVCPSAGSPPFIRAGCGAACCSDVGSVCAFQNSQTSQECWLARAAAKRLPWLCCTFFFFCPVTVKKTIFLFFHFKYRLLLGRAVFGVMVVMVVEGAKGASSELCLDWEGGRTWVEGTKVVLFGDAELTGQP